MSCNGNKYSSHERDGKQITNIMNLYHRLNILETLEL